MLDKGIQQFVDNLNSLREFIQVVDPILQNIVPDSQRTRTSSHSEILYQNSLISLVSAGEWFLSQILHSQFDQYPNSAGIADKTLKLSDLQSFENMEDAQQYLIEQRVEDVLRGSFEEWVSFLKNHFKLEMGYIEKWQNKLVEIIQRRNLLVHNGGNINSIYRRKVAPELQICDAKDAPLKLGVSEDYLTESIDVFEKSFVLIAAELWKKQKPEDENRSSVLNALAYQHLLSERWDIAESFSLFVKSDKQTPEISRLTGLINYWQSVKWQGRFEEVKKHVEQEDLSAKQEKFRLSRFALLDDEGQFFKLLPQVLKNGGITIEDLHIWPLFRNMREANAYMNEYPQ
jgi:hypothetical protein